MVFFAISNLLARPSAGIGVVEVQKPMVIFAISAVLAQPSAGIGVVEVQKLKVFLRLLLYELVLGSCLVVRAPAPGTGGSRVRFLPGPRAGVARCNLHFTATCAEQLAQSKLHRATCADQLAPTSLRRAPCLEQLAQNLRRATCTEQLAQSSLHRATCRERNLHRATCRDQLAGATCAEQLAQSNLHSATCVEQLAQTNLHRPVWLSRACFTKCREKERILQRWADLACDVLLSGQPWSSFFTVGMMSTQMDWHLPRKPVLSNSIPTENKPGIFLGVTSLGVS